MKPAIEKSKLVELRQVGGTVPHGAYEGVWCGDKVEFSTPYGQFEAKSADVRIRGRVPCIVIANEATGSLTVEC